MLYVAGIDIGSTYSKAIVLNDKREVVGTAVRRTGFKLGQASEGVFDDLKKEKELTSRLVRLLSETAPGIPRHRYSLEVFLAIARAMDHNVNLLAALGVTEDVLGEAYRAAQAGRHGEAVSRLALAERTILENCAARERLYRELRDTWEKSRFPSPQMDVFRRERALGLEDWAAKLQRIRLDYAGRHNVTD